jgi:hypothetical protein
LLRATIEIAEKVRMFKCSDYHLPRDKHDTDSAAALVSLGWEAVLPVVPEIMEWVQDSNWPVARVFSPFLVEAG